MKKSKKHVLRLVILATAVVFAVDFKWSRTWKALTTSYCVGTLVGHLDADGKMVPEPCTMHISPVDRVLNLLGLG